MKKRKEEQKSEVEKAITAKNRVIFYLFRIIKHPWIQLYYTEPNKLSKLSNK